MGIGRRTIIAGGGIAAAITAVPFSQVEAAMPTNALAQLLTADGRSINAVRVTSGADGHSKFEKTTIETESPAGGKVTRFLNRKASGVAVYSAPAGHKTPDRITTAGTEILYFIRGSATLSSGPNVHDCSAGTLVVLDDSSGVGHSEKAGPQGYTAIRVKLTA